LLSRFLLLLRRAPRSPLFPYTTLFRSPLHDAPAAADGVWADVVGQDAAVAQFRRAASPEGSLAQAWLITGPPGAGRPGDQPGLGEGALRGGGTAELGDGGILPHHVGPHPVGRRRCVVQRRSEERRVGKERGSRRTAKQEKETRKE